MTALLKPQPPLVRARPEFGWEPVGPVLKEAMPMLRAHWEAVEPHQALVPIDPDFDGIFALERVGAFAVFTARLDGRLIGAHSFVISTTLHRRKTFSAISDMWIVTPSERAGWLGYKMLTLPEEGLRQRGAKLVKVMPSSGLDLDPLLKRAGYVFSGCMREKYIGDDRGHGHQ